MNREALEEKRWTLGVEKKRGVSSDTTDCSSFLPLTDRTEVRKKRMKMGRERRVCESLGLVLL